MGDPSSCSEDRATACFGAGIDSARALLSPPGIR